MSDFLVPLLAVVLFALAAALVFVAVFAVRRYLLTRQGGTFDCSLRRETGRSRGSWIPGVARYESDRLDWFRIFTLSPRPRRSLARTRLVIIERRQPEGTEGYALLSGHVIVRCAYGAATLELSMSEPAYSGFATWLESAPPGDYSPIT
jgi:hypothetical protein